MTIVNLTPHTLNILNADGGIRVDVAPLGVGSNALSNAARVATSRVQTGEVNGLPLFETRFGEVNGLPDAREGVIFVVSGLVAAHPSVRERADVFSPGELVRGPDGQPVGCRGLTRAAERAAASVNLTPASAAGLASAIIAGRWKILTEYGDDTDPRVVAMDAALAGLAHAAGLAPGVIQALAKLVWPGERGDIFERVFTEPERFGVGYGTILEWNDGVTFCAVSGATLES